MELQEMKTALNAKFKQALQEAHLEDLPKGEREAALKGELSLEELDEVAGGMLLREVIDPIVWMEEKLGIDMEKILL